MRGTGANTLQEEEGKGISSFKEDLCVQLVGNFLQQNKSTASNKRRRSADTPVPARLANVETIFPSKGRGSTIIVWSVKRSTSRQRKQVLKTPYQDRRQLSSAPSVMFTCALGKEDQIVSLITTQKRTLPTRNKI